MTVQRPLPRAPHAAGVVSDSALLAAIAEAEYASRRRRDRIFCPGIFAEPAWDMLLDLFIQEHQGRAVSTHSLCIAAAVPPTTALRRIGKLVDAGLVSRRPSAQDNRVIHVQLTANGRAEMELYLRDRLQRQIAEAGLGLEPEEPC